MKNVCIILLIATHQLFFGTSIAQQPVYLPDIGIYPDYMISSGIIDSVLQYSDYEYGDSAMLRRWNYIHQDENNYHESHKYYWNEFLGEWNLKQKHEYSCDNKGRYLLKAHYDYYDARHDRWRGCSSEGCGKREWRYNSNGMTMEKTG